MKQQLQHFISLSLCLPILLLGFLLLLIWQPHPADAESSWDSMTKIFDDYQQREDRSLQQTPEEMDAMIRHAANCERAVIFVHANWSVTSVLSLIFYDDYSVAYLQQPDRPFIDFHFMDYSCLNDVPQSLAELPGWQDLKPSENVALIYGNGELIYLEQGKVIAVEPALLDAFSLRDATQDERINYVVNWTNCLVRAGL